MLKGSILLLLQSVLCNLVLDTLMLNIANQIQAQGIQSLCTREVPLRSGFLYARAGMDVLD
jgi:hypothetical protein